MRWDAPKASSKREVWVQRVYGGAAAAGREQKRLVEVEVDMEWGFNKSPSGSHEARTPV